MSLVIVQGARSSEDVSAESRDHFESSGLPSGARAIPLSRGLFTLVDAEDFEALSQFRWRACVHAKGLTYAVRRTPKDENGEKWAIIMHRAIAGALPTEEVDHWDGDGLNNRRGNLRRCSHQQNLWNQRARHDGFKGVSRWGKDGTRFRVYVRRDGLTRALGIFGDETEAALVYDAHIRRISGEFGRYNFPLPGEMSALRPRATLVTQEAAE